MKNLFSILLLSGFSVAALGASKDARQEHIQMHEQMAKAHQQAVECLKSETSEEQCRKAFREVCASAGTKCGDHMMHRRIWMDK